MHVITAHRETYGPRVPLDVHNSLKDVRSSLKDVHSWTFMAMARARARAWARARTRATAMARFNFRHPLRTRDVDGVLGLPS